jgi:hypothetical protein
MNRRSFILGLAALPLLPSMGWSGVPRFRCRYAPGPKGDISYQLFDESGAVVSQYMAETRPRWRRVE